MDKDCDLPPSLGQPLHSLDRAGLKLRKHIESGKVFIAGKFGTSELDAIIHYLNNPLIKFHDPVLKNMTYNAGVFPSENQAESDSIKEWCSYIIENLSLLDEVALWNPVQSKLEAIFLRMCASHIRSFLPLRSLEPFYQDDVKNRWSLALDSSIPFCVVTPFAKSITCQWEKRKILFREKGSMFVDDADFRGCIRVGYSPNVSKIGEECSWSEDILKSGWFGAVTSIVEDVVKSGSKFAFVGAGGLSLPICFELKKRGISSIHTGGGTQIIFGVFGSRWIGHSVIQKLISKDWIYPSRKEKPSLSSLIEGGCYW